MRTSDESTSRRVVWSSLVTLTLLTLMSHILLLLNDGVYWDGWILYGLYLNSDSESLIAFFREAGLPWTGYFHRVFWYFGDIVFTYKMVAFACILLSVWLVHAILSRLRGISAFEALFVASLYCAYTGYQVYAELIALPYIFCGTLFWLATYGTLISDNLLGPKRIALRALSLLAFFASFNINSLLVVYPAALAIILSQTKTSFFLGWKHFLKAFAGFLPYFLIPILYWVIKTFWWTSSGLYANYNAIAFRPEQWPLLSKLFFNNSVLTQFWNAFDLLQANTFLLCLALAASLVTTAICWAKKEQTSPDFPMQMGKPRQLLSAIYIAIIAVVLFVLVIFPYVVVGNLPPLKVGIHDTRYW